MPTITNVAPHEATGFTMNGAQTYIFTPPGTKTLTLDPMPNGYTWKLTIRLWGGSNAALGSPETAIIFQHQIWKIPGQLNQAGSHTFTIEPTKSMDIDFIDFPRYSVGCDVKVSLDQTPATVADRIALLTYLPSPSFNSAVLGTAILGSFTLPSATISTDWTIIGKSYLGSSFLYENPDFHEWQAITKGALSVDIVRAADAGAFTSAASVGTLTAAFKSALDPRASSLNRGTQVIAMDIYTRARLFTGTVDTIQSEPQKDGEYIVTITAVDTVSQLAARTVYQRTQNRPTDWKNAFTDLLQGFTYVLEGTGSHPQIGAAVREASLAEWLDMYAGTAAVSWHVDAVGRVIVTGSRTAAPKHAIAINSTKTITGTLLNPVAVAAGVNTGALVTGLEIENYTAVYDTEQAEWHGESATITVTNATLERQYGAHSQRITTSGDASVLESYYAGRLTVYNPWQGIKSAEFLPYDWGNYIDDMALCTQLTCIDIGTPISVSYREEKPATAYVARIEHHIDPLTWTTKLELTTN